MKKKILSMVMTVALFVSMMAFAGCGKTEEVKLDKAYTRSTLYGTLEVSYDLKLFTDSTYILTETTSYFDTWNAIEMEPGEDGEVQMQMDNASRITVTSFGSFTKAASTDGDPTHVDLTLNKAERVTYEQHGWLCKWAAQENLASFVGILDSDNWVESNNAYYADANAFLADFAHGYTVMVTDPTGAGVDNGSYVMETLPVKIEN